MAKKIIELPSISRVVAGSTAILELPINPTYHDIVFSLTGTALAVAHVGQIRVLVNGNEIQRYTNLQRLMDLNAYYGRATDTVSEFQLSFARDEYNELAYKRAPALGTQGLQTVTIEMDLQAEFPANGTIVARAMIDTVPQPLGVFNRIREVGLSSSVVGVVETDKIPKSGAVYQAIHCFKSDISRIEFEVDGVKVISSNKATLERLQKAVRPVARVPQTAKATHIDFLLEGDAGDLLNTQNVNDIRARLTFDTVGQCDLVLEQLDVLAA